MESWGAAKWDCRAGQFTVHDGQADFVFRSSQSPDQRYSFWLINAMLIYPGHEPDVQARALEAVGRVQDAWVLKDFKEQATESEPDAAPVSKEDRQRGYVAFARNPLKIVFPATLPTTAERSASLRAQATPGAYTPRHVRRCAVGRPGGMQRQRQRFEGRRRDHRVFGLGELTWLESPGSAWARAIPRSTAGSPRCSIRHVRASLAAGASRWWWLVLHVRDDQAPGTYEGTVTFTPSRGSAHRFPVSVRVWPFKLRQPPGEVFGMYWGRRYILYPDTIAQQFADLREHGCNGITLDLGPKGGFQADGSLQLDFSEMDEILKLAVAHGLTSPIPWNGASRFRSMIRQPLESEAG